MINLEDYKPVAHPFRAILRKHNVTNATVANYLGIHPAYLATILCGHMRMSKPVYAKLQVLIDQLLAQEKEKESSIDDSVKS